MFLHQLMYRRLINYQFNSKWSAEVLGNISQTKFTLIPEFSQLTSGVFSPYFTANLGLDIYFEGSEKDQYNTAMIWAFFYLPGQ